MANIPRIFIPEGHRWTVPRAHGSGLQPDGEAVLFKLQKEVCEYLTVPQLWKISFVSPWLQYYTRKQISSWIPFVKSYRRSKSHAAWAANQYFDDAERATRNLETEGSSGNRKEHIAQLALLVDSLAYSVQRLTKQEELLKRAGILRPELLADMKYDRNHPAFHFYESAY